MQTHIERCNL